MMKLRNAIGIDPDSKGIVCCYVRMDEKKSKKREFLANEEGLIKFTDWLKTKKDIIIAIEGYNGQSKPIEKVLRSEGIVIYSFKPDDVDKFRKAVLGQNKNNSKDAESVARYAMALEAQGKLENHKRVWFPDEELQILSRSYDEKTKESTREINRLWKLIRMASVDLYLALGGSNPSISLNSNKIKNKGVLTLLYKIPDIS
jgi:transposase